MCYICPRKSIPFSKIFKDWKYFWISRFIHHGPQIPKYIIFYGYSRLPVVLALMIMPCQNWFKKNPFIDHNTLLFMCMSLYSGNFFVSANLSIVLLKTFITCYLELFPYLTKWCNSRYGLQVMKNKVRLYLR